MKSRVIAAWILFLSVLLSGCSTLRPVDPSDTRTLVLEEPAVTYYQFYRITFPAGVYKAAGNTDKGTYFSSTAPVQLDTLGPSEGSGGIYLLNDPSKKVRYYVNTPTRQIKATFDTPPRYIVKP